MRFQCPICKELLSAENTETGNAVQCVHCGKQITVPSSRTAPGSVIGDFIILHELGRGGMGIVYAAHQISLDRPAAVKILAESYARNTDFVVGFIKEARAAAKLNHPNIVQAYAVGDDDGIFYFAMEHINGETMKHILQQEKVIPVDRAIDIVRQIAEALDYAWQEEKLVHRDIKPDNIMLTANGRAKLADLGLAKVGNDPGEAVGEEVMGTPQYISPEQLTGDALDNRTDIYCLGATFYHFLTGRFPYEGASAVEIARQHLDGTLIPPNQVNPAIPETVSRVVEKMMAKDPAQRYQSAGQLAEDLALIKRGQNPSAATVSGSLRIQNSNREGNSGKAIPPKLRVPGRTQTPGTETIAESAAASKPAKAPKLVIPGGGPAASPIQKKAPVSAAAQPAKNPVLKKPDSPKIPAPPPPSTPSPSAPAAENAPVKKKPKKKMDGGSVTGKIVKVAIGIAVLLVLAAGSWAAYLHFVKKQNPVQTFSGVIAETREAVKKATKEPEPSEFMKGAGPLIRKLRNPESDRKETALQCYAFLRKQLVPETDEEKNLNREIILFFALQDEAGLEDARVKRISSYETEQERQRIAAEEAEKARLEAERQAREREAEQKVAEAERKRKAEEAARIQRQVAGFKNQLLSLERQMVLDLVRFSEKQDIEGLNAMLDKNINIRDTLMKPEWLSQSDYNRATSQLSYRAKNLKKQMENVWEWNKIFTDGDPALTGINLELHRNICKVERIEKGVIHANAGSKHFSEPVQNLLNNRKFLLFAIKAGIKLQKIDTLPFYFFWKGAYLSAYQVSLDASPRGRSAYSAFVSAYLREAWRDSQLKPQLAKKFRGVPEYDRLNPPPRKAAPRKPAAKKPAAKKPAAKKPAAKKKAAAKKK